MYVLSIYNTWFLITVSHLTLAYKLSKEGFGFFCCHEKIHLERTNPVDEAIYVPCVAEKDFKRGLLFIEYWGGCYIPGWYFPGGLLFSFLFVRPFWMSNSIGFRTPFTTENHVLIERRLWFERWPEVQLAFLHVRTQAVDENHRKLKVTSILTLHEKRVFFLSSPLANGSVAFWIYPPPRMQSWRIKV